MASEAEHELAITAGDFICSRQSPAGSRAQIVSLVPLEEALDLALEQA